MSKLFSIGLEVEEVAVGRVLRQLDGMAGVAKINLNLTGQRRSEIADEAEAEPVRALAAPQRAMTAPPSQQKMRSGQPVGRGHFNQVIAEALRDGELSLKQLGVFVQRRGLSSGSISARLNDMQSRDYVKRTGIGVWKLTSTGLKDFFGNQKSQSPAASASRPNAGNGTGGKKYKEVKPKGSAWWHRPIDNSKGIRRVVLDLLREGPKTTAEVTKALVANGKSDKNMSGTVYKMRVDPPGLVKLSNGIYSLTPHGEREIAQIIKAEQSPQSQAAE